ncbi:hypothetical protein M9H77_12912 [Catharanthus roseus]|uniref:Uncharacterized protein n=1 Tax=Catharanthus roseus TaxID=4058 RepID=A0ACC0BIY5_CATRO|nr:hypothetical protein M9H77_12912 [Catharanthus roseus]
MRGRARAIQPAQGYVCYLYILSIFEVALIRRTTNLPFPLFLFTKSSPPFGLQCRCFLSRKPLPPTLRGTTGRVTSSVVSIAIVSAVGCSLSELAAASRSSAAARATVAVLGVTSVALPEKKKKKEAISAKEEEEGPDCNFVIV